MAPFRSNFLKIWIKITCEKLFILRKRSVIVLLICASAFQADGKTEGGKSLGPAEPYNVLMIIIDDAAPSFHSVKQNGPCRTPNLERIASEGTWFKRAYCNAPACNPSRMAMLKGVQASRSGVYYNSQKFPENWIKDAQSLPAYFRSHGYLSAGYGKIAHAMKHSVPEYSQGYVKTHNNAVDVTHTDKSLQNHIIPGSLRKAVSKNFTWGILPDDWDRDDPKKLQQDTEQADRTIALLQDEHEKPFFAACGFWRPHVTWEVPQRYYKMHPLEDIELPEGYDPFDLEDLPKPGRWMASPDKNHNDILKSGLWKKALQGYYASMAYVDEQVGRVLNALETSEYAENTIVVFLSDNGMHLGEKHHWLKYTLWEQATGVFLSIRVPGYPHQINESPVSLVDIYPTLVALCGLEKPKHTLDGVNLVPILSGEKKTRGNPVLSTWGRGNHAIRNEQHCYIRYRNGDEELYDVRNDAHELRNLADDPTHADIKRKLHASLPETDAPDTVKANADSSEWDDEAFK